MWGLSNKNTYIPNLYTAFANFIYKVTTALRNFTFLDCHLGCFQIVIVNFSNS